MSPKKPIENLSVLCLKAVSDITLDAIKLIGETCIKEFKEYFSKLPRILREGILSGILSLTPLSSFTKWVSFCIFQCSCYKFDSRQLSPKFHEKFAQNLENVYYLNLTDAQISERTLRKLIKRSPLLRALVIPNFATDKVLKDVRNLKNLKLLDISGNAILSEEGLSYLLSESLQVLVIGNALTYSIANYEGYDTLPEILMLLPNLKEIRTYEYTGRSLLELKSPYVSKLKVINDCGTSVEQIMAIISVCPNLEELFLEDPENAVFELLEELRELKKLKVSQFCGGLMKLRIKKLTLQSLELKNMPVNINEICLTLENVLMRSCNIYFHSPNDICFRNLKTIELLDCNVKKDMVMPFLEFCDHLQRLAISNDIGLTDMDIRTLCHKQHLKQLEELWLSLAKQLTSDSVIMLMNHCDRLTLLGTLNGWNIDKMEVNYLRCVVHFTNTDLNLLYFSCF